jgi:hypothetical protein
LIKQGILPNAPVENYLVNDEYSRYVFDSLDLTAKRQANYFDDFVKQAIAQGIEIEVDNEISQNEHEKQGRELVKHDDFAGVLSCNDSPINKSQYEKLENQSRVTQEDTYKMRHFEMRDSLCIESVDETSYKFFNNGVGLKVVSRFECPIDELALLHAAKTISDHDKKTPLVQRKARMLERNFIKKLQVACGVTVTANGATTDGEILNARHDRIKSFLAWAWENRMIINDLGLVKISKGFDENMSWFNKVSAMCGIKMLSKQVTDSSGDRERIYTVNAESLQYISDIVVRRFNRIHKKRLSDLERNLDAANAENEKTGAENFSESFESKPLVTHWT